VAKVAAHLQAEHNVHTISNTLANFVQSAVRRT
jgi:predicted small metal-binding protein